MALRLIKQTHIGDCIIHHTKEVLTGIVYTYCVNTVALVSSILATVLSVVSLTRIAIQNHDASKPRTLSELAASEEQLLVRFRKILVVCGSLFAITIYGYLVGEVEHLALLASAWSLTYLGELALAALPAKGKTLKLHTLCAQAMAFGMFLMACAFWLDLDGSIHAIEGLFALAMAGCAALTILDKRRFIFYELPFLFLSHTSIVLAVIAVRS
jgi:hypothetical protein